MNHDLETHEILRLLSRPDRGPGLMNRRRFLQAAAATGGAAAAMAALPGSVHDAWATAPIGPNDGVLVLLMMAGGNDGLNTVIPFNDSTYYAQRPGVAIAANTTLGLGGGMGLHPNLTYLKQLYDSGNLAVVQGVGYPNPDLSHFNSMALWMQGWGPGPSSSGWIGRYLDGLGGTDPTQAVTVSSSVPLHMIGAARRATSLDDGGGSFGTSGPDRDYDQRLYSWIRNYSSGATGLGAYGDLLARTERDLLDVAQLVAPVYTPALPNANLVKQMTFAARLVNANLGIRVLNIGTWDDFDTHNNENPTHDKRMQELNDGLAAFFGTLNATWASRVTVMTFSEFGRRVESNDSNGTDHGTASCLFLAGSQVNGGLHGAEPSLTDLDQDGNLKFNVDFRSVYATVLDKWLNADSTAILGANFAQLDLFLAAPGAALPAPPPGPTEPGEFVGTSPTRLLDTREGVGAAKAPIGPGATIDLLVGGKGPVPPAGDVTAVVLNVTAAQPTSAGYMTVYPAGEGRPNASNLNFRIGQTVPNLVVAKLGAAGKVTIYNATGSTHAIADVVGFFTTKGGGMLQPATPLRLLDTREPGHAALAAGAVIDVPVLGNGIPTTGVQAVVLNVTVVTPSSAGYVTVYPSGEVRPLASNLNFSAGQTVPNLVMAKVGANGNVSLFNYLGSTHLVVDRLAYFSTTSTAGHTIAMEPYRLLDTRDAKAPLGAGETRSLVVTGKGNVPASGVHNVVLNVTAVDPTAAGYLSVWTSGTPRPYVSNVNFQPKQVVPNLVVAGVSAGGAVDIFNSGGSTHVVVDVVACVVD